MTDIIPGQEGLTVQVTVLHYTLHIRGSFKSSQDYVDNATICQLMVNI